jgi:hypothetical protein
MISSISSATPAYARPRVEHPLAQLETRHLERARDTAREARHLEREAALSALAALEASAAVNAHSASRLDILM